MSPAPSWRRFFRRSFEGSEADAAMAEASDASPTQSTEVWLFVRTFLKP